MSQNSLRLSWTAEEVDERLHNIMVSIHEACVKYGKDANGNVLQGDVLTENSQNCFVRSEQQLIATVGVSDLVVISTKDAVLVAPREPAFAQVLAGGEAVDRQRLFAAQELAVRLRAELETLFRLTDVLIAPSARGEAPAGLDSTGDPVFSRLWSLLGAPCVQVPVGRGSHGMPVGVTLVGPRWQDTQALGAARLLELALA